MQALAGRSHPPDAETRTSNAICDDYAMRAMHEGKIKKVLKMSIF